MSVKIVFPSHVKINGRGKHKFHLIKPCEIAMLYDPLDLTKTQFSHYYISHVSIYTSGTWADLCKAGCGYFHTSPYHFFYTKPNYIIYICSISKYN